GGGINGHRRRGRADRAACIMDIDRLTTLVVGVDFYGRMDTAGGGAADHQRQFETLPLHLGGHVAHFIEGRGYQPRQADDIGPFLPRSFENLGRWHHHAEIDDLVIIALENHADDVLADVVHVALDGGHHDLAICAAVLP